MPTMLKTFQPVEVVSTEGMSREDWLSYRRKGIGGSDLAAIMGVSPFTTARDLYYDKCGIKPAIEEESNWVAKEVGNLLEDLVAKIFAQKTGFKVWAVKKIFSHPDYPFMQANVDFFYERPDGKRGGLECKTTNYNARFKWDNGMVPINYELQCRHYMSIMNLDEWWIACLYGNNENDFIMRELLRDFDYEDSIIDAEKFFWESHVLAGVEPPYTESSDLVLESIKKYFGAADTSAPAVKLNRSYDKALEQIITLKAQQLDHDRKSKKLRETIASIYAPIIDEMGVSCLATCSSSLGDYEISFSPSSRTGINKEALEKLKINHADIYDEYVTSSESRKFSVKKKEVS